MIIIDRIDKKSNKATIEIEGKFISIDAKLLPSNTNEGDELAFIKIANSSRKNKIKSLENKLFKRE